VYSPHGSKKKQKEKRVEDEHACLSNSIIHR
jgi:hypothetical protein